MKAEILETVLPLVSKASRYLGNEINAIHKDLSKVELRFALAFPDVYEVGMSHLGFQLLYHLLNSQPHIACERFFTPWVDMEALLRENRIPLSSLESRTPLSQFHIIGFSLQYELGYSNILKMLALADIPLLAEERNDCYPLIIAGGPCTYNPEPLAAFFDAFVIGEGEEVILELCNTYLEWKKTNAPKSILLDRLAAIDGIYVPTHFQVDYHADGTVKNIINVKQAGKKVVKGYVTNLDAAFSCTTPIVPYMQIIHDRISLEIARGCTRGCRFCMAGMIYRPVRERSLHNILELAETTLGSTGYEELSLTSLSAGDFTAIDTLLKKLMKQHQKNRTAISLPSLRAETLTRSLMEEIKHVRKTGFTIAPEAGTQRLRTVINKNLTEDEIMHTVAEVFAAGWQLIKLYFMIGLPTETQDDIEGIVALATKIRAIGKKIRHCNQLNVSVSTFVPKPHTPFQWTAQLLPDEIREKQMFLMRHLKRPGIRLKWHNPEMSILEGVFARGDRRLSNVLIKAHQLGAGFDGWSEHFKPSVWDEAFAECKVDKYFYLRARATDELLPWEHICCGVSVDFLKAEYQKALTGETTDDCRVTGCKNCGVCGIQQPTPSYPSECTNPPVNSSFDSYPPDSPKTPIYRYRCHFSKSGSARFVSHLELSRCIIRALRRACMPINYTQGYHPHPRVIFYQALPVGIESECEFFDVELVQHIPPDIIVAHVNKHLPSGITMLSVEEIFLKKLFAPDIMVYQKYRARIPLPECGTAPSISAIDDALAAFLKAEDFFIKTTKNGSTVSINIRPLVSNLSLKDNDTIEITVNNTSGAMPRIGDILGEILELDDKQRKLLHITKLTA
jgi:radical SAM family uncharacterized protein/radical SAM-linked protein